MLCDSHYTLNDCKTCGFEEFLILENTKDSQPCANSPHDSP